MYLLGQNQWKNTSNDFNLFFTNGVYFKQLLKVSRKKITVKFPIFPKQVFFNQNQYKRKTLTYKENSKSLKFNEFFIQKELYQILKSKIFSINFIQHKFLFKKYLHYTTESIFMKNFKNQKFSILFYFDLTISIFLIKKKIFFLFNCISMKAINFLKIII
jgi:hypothetical protein